MPGIENWKPLTFDPDREYGNGFNGSYDTLVQSFGYEVVAEASVGDYQGDNLYLLRDGDQYGYLTVGYGSCSGCDALQGCQKPSEVEELRSSIHSGIRWEPSAEAMWDSLCGRDYRGQWYGSWVPFSDSDAASFIDKCLTKLPHRPLGDDVRSLLLNPDTPPAVLADALQEEGWRYVPVGLRSQYEDVVEAVHNRLRKLIRREV